jgi:putative flippase GtrA
MAERAKMRGIILQLLRFGVVGFASNMVLYLIYLLVTGLGVNYRIAMTILYFVGVSLTFAFNRQWTFNYRGPTAVVFRRYVALYLLGYMVNLVGLVIFVDWLDYPHQTAQGLMILIVAALLFSLQKLWVFSHHGHDV